MIEVYENERGHFQIPAIDNRHRTPRAAWSMARYYNLSSGRLHRKDGNIVGIQFETFGWRVV